MIMLNLKRPTILGLMVLIAYLAVGLTAIRSDDKIWAAIVMYLTVFLLCSATLLAIHGRSAWAGFAIFGWAYFLLFNPNEPDRWPGSISMILATYVVRFFRNPNVSNNSLRSILSIASVAMGCLGALVGGRIGRESDTKGHDGASADSRRGVR
jgi:hypothetical protein